MLRGEPVILSEAKDLLKPLVARHLTVDPSVPSLCSGCLRGALRTLTNAQRGVVPALAARAGGSRIPCARQRACGIPRRHVCAECSLEYSMRRAVLEMTFTSPGPIITRHPYATSGGRVTPVPVEPATPPPLG